MPRRSSTLLKWMPLVAPWAGSTYTRDLAASRLALRASGVEMSGRGAPSRTATPMPVRARSVRVPATTRPSRIASSTATSVMITTSIGSPPASLPRDTPTVPKESATVLPVSWRKVSDSSVTMARTAPALWTLISSAPTRAAPSAVPAVTSTSASHHRRVIRLRPSVPVIVVASSGDRDQPGLRLQVVELSPRGVSGAAARFGPPRWIHRLAVGAHPVRQRPPRRLRPHQPARDRQLAQHDEAHAALRDQLREPLRSQDRVETVEAPHRHHRLAGGHDQGRGQLSARRREQEALAVTVGAQERDQMAPVRGLPGPEALPQRDRHHGGAQPADVGGGD